MLFKAESREMDAGPEDAGLGENADTANAINFHFHVRVTVRVPEVGKMGPPCGVFRVSFHNDGVLVQGIGKSERSLGLLPRVQVIRLFSTQPFRKRAPYI